MGFHQSVEQSPSARDTITDPQQLIRKFIRRLDRTRISSRYWSVVQNQPFIPRNWNPAEPWPASAGSGQGRALAGRRTRYCSR